MNSSCIAAVRELDHSLEVLCICLSLRRDIESIQDSAYQTILKTRGSLIKRKLQDMLKCRVCLHYLGVQGFYLLRNMSHIGLLNGILCHRQPKVHISADSLSRQGSAA